MQNYSAKALVPASATALPTPAGPVAGRARPTRRGLGAAHH